VSLLKLIIKDVESHGSYVWL